MTRARTYYSLTKTTITGNWNEFGEYKSKGAAVKAARKEMYKPYTETVQVAKRRVRGVWPNHRVLKIKGKYITPVAMLSRDVEQKKMPITYKDL